MDPRLQRGSVRNAIQQMSIVSMFMCTLALMIIGPVVWFLFAYFNWKVERRRVLWSGTLLACGYGLLVFGITNNLTWACVLSVIAVITGCMFILRAKGPRSKTDVATQEFDTLKMAQTPLAIDPEEFEGKVAEMFRRYGYKVIQTPYQGDHGIDLKVIKGDEFGAVQCKRYAGSVGEPMIRDFYGAMQHEQVDVGYFVTTGHFTTPAYTWVKGKKIVLIDGEALQKMFSETKMA